MNHRKGHGMEFHSEIPTKAKSLCTRIMTTVEGIWERNMDVRVKERYKFRFFEFSLNRVRKQLVFDNLIKSRIGSKKLVYKFDLNFRAKLRNDESFAMSARNMICLKLFTESFIKRMNEGKCMGEAGTKRSRRKIRHVLRSFGKLKHENINKIYGVVEGLDNLGEVQIGYFEELCDLNLEEYVCNQVLQSKKLMKRRRDNHSSNNNNEEDEKVSTSKKEEFSLREKLNILVQLAEGMNYLHSKNLVHRHLHLRNVMLMRRTSEDQQHQHHQETEKENHASSSSPTSSKDERKCVFRVRINDYDCVFHREKEVQVKKRRENKMKSPRFSLTNRASMIGEEPSNAIYSSFRAIPVTYSSPSSISSWNKGYSTMNSESTDSLRGMDFAVSGGGLDDSLLSSRSVASLKSVSSKKAVRPKSHYLKNPQKIEFIKGYQFCPFYISPERMFPNIYHLYDSNEFNKLRTGLGEETEGYERLEDRLKKCDVYTFSIITFSIIYAQLVPFRFSLECEKCGEDLEETSLPNYLVHISVCGIRPYLPNPSVLTTSSFTEGGPRVSDNLKRDRDVLISSGVLLRQKDVNDLNFLNRLMTVMWDSNLSRRPSFDEIVKLLVGLIKRDGGSDETEEFLPRILEIGKIGRKEIEEDEDGSGEEVERMFVSEKNLCVIMENTFESLVKGINRIWNKDGDIDTIYCRRMILVDIEEESEVSKKRELELKKKREADLKYLESLSLREDDYSEDLEDGEEKMIREENRRLFSKDVLINPFDDEEEEGKKDEEKNNIKENKREEEELIEIKCDDDLKYVSDKCDLFVQFFTYDDKPQQQDHEEEEESEGESVYDDTFSVSSGGSSKLSSLRSDAQIPLSIDGTGAWRKRKKKMINMFSSLGSSLGSESGGGNRRGDDTPTSTQSGGLLVSGGRVSINNSLVSENNRLREEIERLRRKLEEGGKKE